MHKAKGLIGTMFSAVLHENVIPGSFWVPPQTKFLGDLPLACALNCAALHDHLPPGHAAAWEQAKHLKTAEEFRLLYVAMTRAKRLLWMSAAQRPHLPE